MDDSGKVLGLAQDYKILGARPDQDGYEQFLSTLLFDQLGRDLVGEMTISFHIVQGKDVCLIDVAPGHRPVYLVEGADQRLYVRAGNSSRSLNTAEAVEYVRTRWRDR